MVHCRTQLKNKTAISNVDYVLCEIVAGVAEEWQLRIKGSFCILYNLNEIWPHLELFDKSIVEHHRILSTKPSGKVATIWTFILL